ncbi:acyl-CoA N-acyltransferase [Globomyces pollinis-pini]|nr:acyl-CoA N-acyltransferase [Globomyces pollinis-pini]
MELKVRLVEINELEFMIKLSQSVQIWLRNRSSLQEIEVSKQEAITAINREIAYFILFMDNPAPIGMILVDKKPSDHVISLLHLENCGQVIFLSKFMLDPDYIGQGIGEQFLNTVLPNAIPITNQILALDCWAGNENLRKLYQKCGFTLFGVFPEQDWEIAVYVRPTIKD